MRKYSQIFLKNKNTAQKIVKIFYKNISPENKIIEIGPGKGILTEYLLEKYKDNYLAIEIDPLMIEKLKNKFALINIINRDFLEIDLDELKISYFIGNLPYHISTAIIEKLLEYDGFKYGVFMLQKEVCEKITAKSGNSIYGFISALTQIKCDVDYNFTVSRFEFLPIPKVDSGIITLKIKDKSIRGKEFKRFKNFLSIAFRHKRKTLLNSLHLSTTIDKKEIISVLKRHNLNENTRAEELSSQKLFELFCDFNL